MAEDAPNLAEFLDTQRNYNSPCWCVDAPPELVKQVDAALASGSKQWHAMAKWLSEQLDRPMHEHAIQKHQKHRAQDHA